MVNVTNGDTLPVLPADAVAEVPAAISAEGPAPLPVDPVQPLLGGNDLAECLTDKLLAENARYLPWL